MNGLAPRLSSVLSTIRFHSFDTSHAEGRSRERHRRAALTAIAAGLAKAIAIGTSLITIPMALGYLGTERFGLWMTISSLLAVLGFADLGIGNGVLNAVAAANGKDDLVATRTFIDSGCLLLITISVVLMCCFAVAYEHVAWYRLFNVHSTLAVQEVGPAVAVFATCFVLNIPLGIVQRVQLGLQEGFVSNLWQLFASVSGLVGVLTVIHYHAGLPWLVLALAGAPVVGAFMNGVFFFGFMRPNLRPSFRLVNWNAIWKIARLGFLFLVLQSAVALAFASDNIIIARELGPEAVTQYAIPAKMFSIISLVIGMLISPLWPAYGEAVSRGDIPWVRSTLVRSILGAVIFAAVASVSLVFVGPSLLKFWVGDKVGPSSLLLIGLAVWTTVDAGGNALAMFLNGANIVRMQVVIASIFAVSCIALKIFMVAKLGITGVPWATVISYVCLSAIPCAIIVPRLVAALSRPRTLSRAV